MQLGRKVPLWGGFNAAGGFALKLWTPKPKMTQDEWKAHVPALKRAAATAKNCLDLSCLNMCLALLLECCQDLLGFILLCEH